MQFNLEEYTKVCKGELGSKHREGEWETGEVVKGPNSITDRHDYA